MDLSNLTAAVNQFIADQQKLNTDVRAYIAANPPADPAQQAQVDDLTARLTASDATLESLDAAVRPAPAQAPETPSTPTA